MTKFLSVSCLSVFLVGLGSSAMAQRMQILVGGAQFSPLPMAVPVLRVIGGQKPNELVTLQRQVTKRLRGGVELTRAFQLLPVRSYLNVLKEPLGKPVFANWLHVGASGLIQASIEALPEGQVAVTYLCFDVLTGRLILKKRYVVHAQTAVRTAYQYLDVLNGVLTGQTGVLNSQIAFVKSVPGGKAVYIADMDGRHARRMTSENLLSLLPTWAPKGEALYLTSYLQGNPDLYRLDLNQEKTLQGVSHKRGLNTGAAVSPDGLRLAMTLSVDGNTEIYVMDLKTRHLSRLTNNWGQDVSPAWSPDGQYIAFVSARSGSPQIYVMRSDGSEIRRLTYQGKYNQEPSWSPRPGGKIAFTGRDEHHQYDIFLVDPHSGAIERLTQDQGNNASPSFSPDGQQLLFTSDRLQRHMKQLFLMDVDGQNQRGISRELGVYETPAWGPRRVALP